MADPILLTIINGIEDGHIPSTQIWAILPGVIVYGWIYAPSGQIEIHNTKLITNLLFNSNDPVLGTLYNNLA